MSGATTTSSTPAARGRARGHDVAEGPTSPAVGRDEWVARHGDDRAAAAARSARSRQRLARGPVVGVARALRRGRLPAFRSSPTAATSAASAFDTVALHAARARPQRRRRLGRPARPRLRRLLRRSARTPTRCLSSDQFGIHLPTIVVDPDRRRRSARVVGFLVGLPSRRLAGDYLAIVTLFFGQLFLTRHDERRRPRSAHNVTGGPNGILDASTRSSFFGRDARRRSDGRRLQRRLPLRRARRLRRRLRRAALRQPLAHGPRLALAARGPARRRGDGHAGQLAQADGVRLRRRGRRADRDDLRRAERERLPADLLRSRS